LKNELDDLPRIFLQHKKLIYKIKENGKLFFLIVIQKIDTQDKRKQVFVGFGIVEGMVLYYLCGDDVIFLLF